MIEFDIIVNSIVMSVLMIIIISYLILGKYSNFTELFVYMFITFLCGLDLSLIIIFKTRWGGA